MRLFVLAAVALLAGSAHAATLEQLSVEEMSLKSTLIVRGKVSGCTGEQRKRIIYTRCRVTVSERWKGTSGSQVDFYVPGGSVQGLKQTFTGTPKLNSGEEYVLFLWAGRSGLVQIIGLSQGVLGVQFDSKGGVTVKRAASTEVMLDASGEPVADAGLRMSLGALRQRVDRALGDSK